MEGSDCQSLEDFLPETLTETFSFEPDESLVQATVTALRTGRLTPLIKEELKCTIQTRRLSEGKDELRVEFNSSPKQTLRPDEVQRLERRREQNRRAAQKFREKKRKTADVLLKESKKLESSNTSLTTEIRKLIRERDQLTCALDAHQPKCTMGLESTLSTKPP